MPQSMRCSLTHTENREALSVGQSSSSMFDRTEQPVVETMAQSHDRTEQPVVETMAQSHDRTGQPVFETSQEQNPGLAQIRTLLDRQREQVLAYCQAEIRKQISRLIVTEEVYKN